ncbi:kynurenine--oxoglutarate transaminase 1 isoform X3 [Alexandromys fortis]|uniref:kynurenine--oxoglutarate transaminase 1 isoform X3 n=1 Tax=Alexandromys fortis TaxID=100897 RepID=UPI002152942F|nr:kynurenine--oxoglutarate transaminase 1 isoform X3 [Microtus fortis]
MPTASSHLLREPSPIVLSVCTSLGNLCRCERGTIVAGTTVLLVLHSSSSALRESSVTWPSRLHLRTRRLIMSKQLQARRLNGIDHNPWVEFIRLAKEYDVVNLGQGFPDFSPPDFAVQAFQQATSGDFMLNQYTMAFGYPPLTKILASFFGKLLGQELDPLKNMLVTVGAYGALFTAFQALVDEGDEVIIIEPAFDCYEPMTLMAGGRPVFVSLKPSPAAKGQLESSNDWQLDPTELASKFTPRTKALVLNTPNNPLGKVFSKKELELVADLCQQHDVLCISDEVYQWLVYDGHQHVSIASLPGMWERTLTIGSAGKSFSATGWKVGWVMGPDRILKHLRTVHQNSIFHCPTQAQAAVAQCFEREQQHFGQPSSYFLQLPQAMKLNRDHMIRSLQSVGLKPLIPQGSYFLIADISDFKSKMPNLPGAEDEPYDRRFAKWMIKNKPLHQVEGTH